MLHQFTHFIDRLTQILQTPWGWALGIGLALGNYFAAHSFIVFLVVAVTLIDAAWGIAVSISRGQFTLSELARLTIAKLAVYGCAVFVFVGLDKFMDSTLATSLVAASIILVEFWSSCASMLILFPNFLFLRLMKKALVGEIASKLKMSEEEVLTILEEERKEGKEKRHDE